jgi:hypothetical protein
MGAGDRGGDWSQDERKDTWQFKGPRVKGSERSLDEGADTHQVV